VQITEISKFYPPEIGGIENHVEAISQELLRLGNNIDVLALTHEEAKIDIEYYQDYYLKIIRFRPSFQIYRAPITNQYLFQILNLKSDIVHLHYPNPFGEIASLIKNFLNRNPIIITYHGEVTTEMLLKRIVVGLFQRLITKPLFEKSKVIICTTEEYPKESPFLRPFLKKISIIPNGVDIPEIQSASVDRKSRQKFRLIFIGRLVSWKGIFDLLQTIKNITDETKMPVHLTVIGDGEEKEAVVNTIQTLDISNYVTFLGRVDRDVLIRELTLSDVLILPSTGFQESFGIVLLEAMAMRTCVIASDLPGPAAVVEHMENGIIFRRGNITDLAEKIELLYSDSTLRETLITNGYELVKSKYNWATISKDLYSEMKRIVEK
jgi:rhamnosyl/mannosyltransferase